MIWHNVLGMAFNMSTFYIYPSRQPVRPSWATWRSCPCLFNQHHRQLLQLATWKRRTRRRCRAPQAPTPWCSPSTRPSTSSTLLGQGWDYQKKNKWYFIWKSDSQGLPPPGLHQAAFFQHSLLQSAPPPPDNHVPFVPLPEVQVDLTRSFFLNRQYFFERTRMTRMRSLARTQLDEKEFRMLLEKTRALLRSPGRRDR